MNFRENRGLAFGALGAQADCAGIVPQNALMIADRPDSLPDFGGYLTCLRCVYAYPIAALTEREPDRVPDRMPMSAG